MSGSGPAGGTWVCCAAVLEEGGGLAAGACLVSVQGAAALRGLDLARAHTGERIEGLARQVRAVVPGEVVLVGAERVRGLAAKLGSVAKLLAWAQAKALAELLGRYPEARRVACEGCGPELRELRVLSRIAGDLEWVKVEGSEPPAGMDAGVAAGLAGARALARAGLARAKAKGPEPAPKGPPRR